MYGWAQSDELHPLVALVASVNIYSRVFDKCAPRLINQTQFLMCTHHHSTVHKVDVTFSAFFFFHFSSLTLFFYSLSLLHVLNSSNDLKQPLRALQVLLSIDAQIVKHSFIFRIILLITKCEYYSKL